MPVIAHVATTDDWCVLTTHHLVVCKGSSVDRIPWLDLREFLVDQADLHPSANPKERLHRMTLIAENRESIEITTDPGQPFIGFWNCLIMAKRMAPEEQRRRDRLQP